MLCWNGEAWRVGGGGEAVVVSEDENDGAVVFRLLVRAAGTTASTSASTSTGNGNGSSRSYARRPQRYGASPFDSRPGLRCR